MATCVRTAAVLLTLCAIALAGPTSSPATGPVIVDDFDYPNDAAAQGAWKPMGSTAQVTMVRSPGAPATLKMPCNFKGTAIDRASWDRKVRLDLTGARGLQFEIACDDAAPISFMLLYLHSGGGWYSCHFSAAAKEFATVTIDKALTNMEDQPSGWANIDIIRISAWRGGDTDTALRIRNLRVLKADGSIVVVRGESAAATAKDEIDSVRQYAQSMARRLDELGLGYTIISDLDLTDRRLSEAPLVILPHNPIMPAASAAVLEKYLGTGGKMLVFYTLPGRLEQAVGIRSGKHVSPPQRGALASIRPAEGASPAGMPPVTRQSSWNIHEIKPIEGRSKVVADWYDAAGKPAPYAAIVAPDNCVFMSHVLLEDDVVNQRRLLIAMAGQLRPELWASAAKASIDRIFRAGPHKDLAGLEKLVQAAKDEKARLLLDGAITDQRSAKEMIDQGKCPQAVDLAEQAHQKVITACCLLEKPAKGEHRAFWCHNAFGVDGMDWDAAVKNLADNGFTAIIPNMLWAGLAYYKSDVLPVAAEVKDRGDQIELCLAACRKYGLECHVWKVNWNMGGRAPKEFADRMRDQGRTQVDPSGKPIAGWLCPSHPANRQLEIDSMVEVATRYDVSGIHFDYIRYPGSEGCFCDGCRERFEKTVARKVANWPGDVQTGPLRAKWLDFRRDNITAVVAAVSESVRKARPKCKISAAVFANWAVDRDTVGQDWKLWCEKGYLDFVCPMDYTPYSEEFGGLVARQVKWAGKVPCYPGIGLSCWEAQGDIFTLFRQIDITRQARTGGFTIFNYSLDEASQTVPRCGLGITRKE